MFSQRCEMRINELGQVDEEFWKCGVSTLKV